MRSHGVPDFPDPKISRGSNGGSVSMSLGAGSGLNPNSPAFQAARQACRSLQPGGANLPAQSTQELATDVKFAACMRSHDYPSFPDPDSHGVFHLPPAVDANSAQFRSATAACREQTGLHGLSINQNAAGGGS